jgi:putative SOS response-associated peptidase YedK
VATLSRIDVRPIFVQPATRVDGPLVPDDERRPELPPNYNLAPTQLAPVVRLHRESGTRHLDLLRWGLLPHFATDPKRQRPINARAETLATSGMVKAAFARRRCLVPAAAFYEWRKLPEGGKQPYAITRADGAPLALGPQGACPSVRNRR